MWLDRHSLLSMVCLCGMVAGPEIRAETLVPEAAPAIEGITRCPQTGRIQLQVAGSGATGEVLALFRSGASNACNPLAEKTWCLVEDDVRPATRRIAAWTDPDAVNGEGSLFYAVARTDLDLDEDGIPDAHEQLLPVRDLPCATRARWARAGMQGRLPDYPIVANAKDYGAQGDGVSDDATAIQNALNHASPTGAVYLPPGTYRLAKTLHLNPRQVLRGAGATETRLLFEGTGTAARCISICRWESLQTAPKVAVTGGLQQGSTELAVTNVAGFAAGDIVELEQDNEPDWNLTESWQLRLPGQLIRLKGVDAARGVLLLDRPLRLPFHPARNPKVQRLATIAGSGIEDLYIARTDAITGHTIEFKYAVNCWVRGVESHNTFKAHVWMDRSYECEIRSNYLHDAHDYGGGGCGYGAACGRHTSDCLVEDNIFNHLRHSMSVGIGANGNVFGYNFSTNRARDPISGNPQPDISVHGNYVFMNLFEGNVLEDADVPDYYWPAGPGNTLFRNRLVNPGIAVEVGSEQQNVVANELVKGTICRDACVVEATIFANNENGHITWPPCGEVLLPASFYRCVRPAFFPMDDPAIRWPAIGPEYPDGGYLIPAQQRAGPAPGQS